MNMEQPVKNEDLTHLFSETILNFFLCVLPPERRPYGFYGPEAAISHRGVDPIDPYGPEAAVND
jgi:hypothetical protein